MDSTEFVVIGRDGTESKLTAPAGLSLMEAVREGGYNDLLALCGGCCSYATCHVVVESGMERLHVVGGEDEDDLLDSLDYRVLGSRLSCQLIIDAEAAGMVVRIAAQV